MQVANTNFGSGTSEDQLVYLDSTKYDTLVGNLETSASVMNIADTVFSKAESANGTEAMNELIAELKEVQNVSNYYKTHISFGVVPLLNSVKKNIEKTAKAAGDALKKMEHH